MDIGLALIADKKFGFLSEASEIRLFFDISLGFWREELLFVLQFSYDFIHKISVAHIM